MNPLTNMKNVTKLSERELYNSSSSTWHDQYKDSAWIFVGGLPYDLTEGDIICIFSQYGEIVNVNLIRAKDTGKSKGFCFICYEDQRSTNLAVDNLNGIKILNRIIRVDHVQNYKVPQEGKKTDEETKKLYAEGCAPKPVPIVVPKQVIIKEEVRETLVDQIESDIKLPARLPIYTNVEDDKHSKDKKKKKKEKKKKKSKKKSKKSDSDTSDTDSSNTDNEDHKVIVKHEKRSRSRSIEKKYEERRDRDRYDRDRTKRNDYEKERYKSSQYNSSDKSKNNKSPQRSDRSRSREKEKKDRSYGRGVSPSIPKRWR